MQSVEVRIDGEYWDSHLYNNRLYLFTRQGTVRVYDWDKLIGRAGWSRDELPFARQFLTRGRSWYSSQQQQLLKSPLYRKQVLRIVERLGSTPMFIRTDTLRRALMREHDSPLFPHNDAEVYYGTLFLGGTEGIVAADAKEADDYARVTDLPCLRLSGSYESLAVAAGPEGLWQLRVPVDGAKSSGPRVLSGLPCLNCSWARFDVVASASDGIGYVAGFRLPDAPGRRDTAKRELLEVVPGEAIFESGGKGFLIGAFDRLLLVRRDSVEADAWNPYRRTEDNQWNFFAARTKRYVYDFTGPEAEVIDAASTSFGLVLETGKSLIVFASDGTRKRFGEPVNWRTFPRSQRYINHLHIVQDTAVRIHAYVHDYFLDNDDRAPSAGRPTGDE